MPLKTLLATLLVLLGSVAAHLGVTTPLHQLAAVAAPTTLTPGTGFSGPTTQPPVQGTGAGSDAKAIARWDVVPYQTFDTTLNIGVVAFHINDIAKVAFSVNGGPWTDVSQMTLNPETNVVEYW